MADTKWLKDENNVKFFPRTHINSVKDDDGNTVGALLGQVETDVATLQAAYQGLSQSNIVVVADHTAVTTPAVNTIYREQGTTSYSDWMYYDGAWYKMAEYNNAIDATPTQGSDNLVRSGGVFNANKVVRITAVGSTTPSGIQSGEYWLYTTNYILKYYNGGSNTNVAWNTEVVYSIGDQLLRYNGSKLEPFGDGFFDNIRLEIGAINTADGVEAYSAQRVRTSAIYVPTFFQLPTGYCFAYIFWYNLDGSFNSIQSIDGQTTYLATPKADTYLRLVLRKSPMADFSIADIDVLQPIKRLSLLEEDFSAHANSNTQELAIHTDLLVNDWAQVDAEYRNENRFRRGTDGAWGTTGGSFNIARVTIPTNATLVRLKIHNNVRAPMKGYLPFFFSANTSGSNDYISAPEVCEVGEIYDVDKIYTIPSGALYIYIATNETGTVGQTITSANLVANFNIASGENGETIISAEQYYGKISQGLIDSTTGEVVPNTTAYPNAIFAVEEDWEYIYTHISAFSSNRGYGFFLEDNSWVGTKPTANEWRKIVIPTGAVEFRMCWQPSIISVTDQMFIIGKKKTMQQSFDMTKNVLPFQFMPNFAKINDIPTQTRIPSTSDINDIYGRYDALMALYPNYITRIDCSAADSVLGITRPSALNNIPIYIYKFSPLISRDEGDWKGKSLPKAMILTGTHSNEKMGIYTTYSLMKYICDTWKTDENAELLRTMCEIYVMPLVNPWGFIHAGETISGVTTPGRDNYNNVNLNRNFPTSNWIYIAPASDGNYSGETAGSEYETKIVMYYVEQIMPDFFLDAHTGNMNVHGEFQTINTIKEINCKKVALAAGRTGTTILVKSDTNFPDSADISLVDVGGGNANGEAFLAGWETTGKLSFLTEQCVEQKWLNGTLTTSVQSINTDLIYTMNMKMTMNLLLRGLKAATEL